MTAAQQRQVSILVFLAMIVLWEILSFIFPAELVPGVPLIPGWEVLFSSTLLSMSDYWTGGFGVEAIVDGGSRSYAGAVLSILEHSWATIVRLFTGMLVGAITGTLLGLIISWSDWTRRLIDLPVQVMRTLPLLAMVPLFQLWFGTYFMGKVIFIAYGVGVLFIAGTMNAVRNVPAIYIDNARTLGASKLEIYRSIILPAIFPELRATIMLSLGIAWATVIGAEYLGAQSGLGYILLYAQTYGFVDRMFFVALLFVLYASITYAIFNRVSLRMLRWAPRGQS